MTTILVTGGAGYIGTHTDVELLNKGYDVVCVDNYSNSSPKALDRVEEITGKTVKRYEGDVRDEALMDRIFTENDIDWVIHFASLKSVGESVAKPIEYYDNNLNSTIVLLKAMRAHDVKKVIFSSSATVYGTPKELPLTEESQTGGTTNPYGTTKFFEEQILHHAASLEQYSDSPYGDAGDYLQRYLGEDYKAGFLQLIADARRATRIPVIASINCVAAGEEWIEYAAAMARAGASALELNIFIQPVDAARSSQELERLYVTIAQRVCAEVKIPVSVKLAMRFTNVVAMAAALESVGVKGAVLFNRFFEPDVDVERMTFVEGSPYSEASELRNVLRTTAICVGALPRMDFAVSTGVHDGEAAVKALLCGAAAVEVCTAIHREGFDVIARMNEWIDAWAARHGITALDEFKGRLGFGKSDSEFFQRVQYMKYFPGKD